MNIAINVEVSAVPTLEAALLLKRQMVNMLWDEMLRVGRELDNLRAQTGMDSETPIEFHYLGWGTRFWTKKSRWELGRLVEGWSVRKVSEVAIGLQVWGDEERKRMLEKFLNG